MHKCKQDVKELIEGRDGEPSMSSIPVYLFIPLPFPNPLITEPRQRPSPSLAVFVSLRHLLEIWGKGVGSGSDI